MIRAVERALAIFDAFDPEHTGLSLQEIGRRIGLSKATTYRLVNTLDQAGYLVRLDNNQYCLSLKLVRLAGMVRSNLSIREIVRPIMSALVKETGETITLNTIAGHERLCIEVFDTPSPLMNIVRQGERVPLVYGATAKILLAYMSEADVDAAIRAVPGGEAAIDRPALLRQLAKFRRQSYALTRSDRVEGITAIAVPIRTLQDEVRYSLAVTGPSVRIDPRQSEFIPLMVEAGKDVSNHLGGRAALPVEKE